MNATPPKRDFISGAWMRLAAAAGVGLLLVAGGASSAMAQSGPPRLERDAVCQWRGLGGERVLLCPARTAAGERVFRIVDRRPSGVVARSPQAGFASRGPSDPFEAAATSPRGPQPRDAAGRPIGFSPRVGGSVGATADPDNGYALRPRGRVGVGSSVGSGSVRPRVGVGVGIPSGRVSAGVGTRVRLGRGVSLGTGLSVPLGGLF